MSSERYVAKAVGALPFLARFLERVGLRGVIDRIVPKDDQAYLSAAEVTEVLVANRLASPRPLYRVQDWADRAGVAQVFHFQAAWLNDDRLGRVLEDLGQNSQLIRSAVCLAIAREFGIGLKRFHYDLTTVWLQGDYEETHPSDTFHIQYTKDGKDDPAGKAFRLGVSTFDDGEGAISLACQVLDGTATTCKSALKNLIELKRVIGEKLDNVLQVSDRAGVTAEVVAKTTAEHMQVLGPLTTNEALKRKMRELLAAGPMWQKMSYLSDRQARKPSDERDAYQAFEVPYSFKHEDQVYPARLIVVLSDGKRKRDEKSRLKRQKKIEQRLSDLLEKSRQPRDPRGSKLNLPRNVEKILATYPEGKLYEVTWAGPAEAPTGFTWKLVSGPKAGDKDLDGIYVAATTLPAAHSLDQVFTWLKQQWRVEDSHRILKGRLKVSPVFLHRPDRIEGLILVLWMALVTYQLLEREWRKQTQGTKSARWTTLTLLRLFEGYSYVGVAQAGGFRWVPCLLPDALRMVFRTMGLRLPDTS